jgi:cytochrome c-type biogenesis protein CcmE
MTITLNAKRKRRLMVVGLLVVGVAIAAALALSAFRENLLYFYSPTEVLAGKAPAGHKFRLGGLVVEGSVKRETDDLTVNFGLTDTASEIQVSYSGILPDLFREGQGIVAHGRLNDAGVFVADEVLAKHDENYMPPEVAAALKDAMPGNEALKHPGNP